ncbi:MAG TPA: glycoside hydrolase family 97 catalytic domain-containing protein, partial [Cellvibrio sp.]|nr:glycoside hydrolase family 97 catalytic domain-containing protein [Cellvibrio sp.]
MKILIVSLLALCLWGCNGQSPVSLSSPDNRIRIDISLDGESAPRYAIAYQGKTVLQDSRLGIALNDADFTGGLTLKGASSVQTINDNYELWTGKQRQVNYTAHEQTLTYANAEGRELNIIFRVSDDGVAFRYAFPGESEDVKQVLRETTSFALPKESLAWLQPMSVAQTGWMNTNPSYEEHYQMAISVGTSAPTEAGWVFPALFNIDDAWLLITEADMNGSFHASRLQQHADDGEYKIGTPMAPEVFTGGALLAQSTLPFASPWRIITVGSLATIMESTLGTDLAAPAIEMDTDFIKPGIASWSWGLLKDDATVYDIQKQFIDYAADMHWPYTLVDADWDRKIGYEKIKELADYAAKKNVGLLVWYNSSGAWNKTEYTPKSALLTHEQRQQEFSRLQEMGVKGVKIDFFAGDGQSMMQYYNDILKDAAQYELLVNYHGSSLPRGLQRTYPHMMTMESVKGFEMITFGQEAADLEASHASVLPFARNAFDPMDFTPTVFHDIPNIERKTSNGFQLALPIIFLSGIQHIVETPEGMATVPYFVKAFMRKVPARWDAVKFIDGYPG